jgi:hypothetical protein
MAESTMTTKPATAISGTVASLSFTGAVSFIVLLTALHLIKPELDPSWHFISEYAIGENGWMMVLAFLSLAFSYVTLFLALRTQIRSIGGTIGLGSLLLSATGLTIAGLFTTDPITASEAARTASGKLHELGALLDVTPIAAVLINWSLARRNAAWSPARRSLLLTGVLPLIGLVVFMGSVAMMLPSDGKFGPDVLVGWPNRFLMLTYCAWLMTLALQAAQLRKPNA